MASTDALPQPKKNVAYRVIFPILDADGDLVSGAAGLDSEVSKDQGTFADCTNEATEIATASGMYYLDLTSTEMNADCVAIIVKTTTTGAKTTPLVLYPEEAGDIRVNVTQVNGTSQTAGDLAALLATLTAFVDTEMAATLAAVDTEIGSIITSLAALATAIDALPTNAELATALGTADDVVLTAIDALPTNAELATALAAADDAVLAAVAGKPTLAQILTTQMTESYAANGVAPTLAQALFAIHQHLMSFGIVGASKTVKKLDNTTDAFIETLDSSSAPTALSRS